MGGERMEGEQQKGREKEIKIKIPVTFKLPQTKVDSFFLYLFIYLFVIQQLKKNMGNSFLVSFL